MFKSEAAFSSLPPPVYTYFPNSTPGLIVAGNCAAGGKSRPAKLTMVISNERARMVITNFLQIAIGLRWFPSIFQITAGLRAMLDKDLFFFLLLYSNIGMATGVRCLQVDLQFCFETVSNSGNFSVGFSTLICLFDNQNWLFQSEHKTDGILDKLRLITNVPGNSTNKAL